MNNRPHIPAPPLRTVTLGLQTLVDLVKQQMRETQAFSDNRTPEDLAMRAVCVTCARLGTSALGMHALRVDMGNGYTLHVQTLLTPNSAPRLG